MSENKLYRPYVCDIPLEVRECRGITDGCKIYFGELKSMCYKKGIIYWTDEELSECFGIPVRTLKRFHSQLESHGFITRINYQTLTKGEEGICSWRNLRKMQINFGFIKHSNNVCDGAKNGPFIEGAKNGPFDEGAKNGPSLNNKIESTKQNQQQPGQAAAAFLCLNDIDIPASEKAWISKTFDESKVQKALKFTQSLEKKQEIKTSFLQTLKWACTLDDSELCAKKSDDEIIKDNKEFLINLTKYDNKQINLNTISVGYKYIEFIRGPIVIRIEIDDKKFIGKVREEFLKLGIEI